MQSLPIITHDEFAVLGAAVVLLWLAPGLLSWLNHRRQARLRAAASTVDSGAVTGDALVDAPLVALEAGTEPPLAVEDAATAAPWLDEPYSEAGLPRAPGADASEARTAGSEEPRQHHFRLQDLRRVRLRDWPPQSVRHDPERHQAWLEAERLLEDHQSAVNAPVLSSPCPAQSVCLGAVEEEGSRSRLRFLLFPVLWPADEDQALAEVIFEIDRSTGEASSRVQARPKG